jgi:hypothetical protein
MLPIILKTILDFVYEFRCKKSAGDPGQEVETIPLILCVSDDALNHTPGAGPSEYLQLHHCGSFMRIY